MAKPVYETFVVESHCSVPREAVWRAHLAQLAQSGFDEPGDPAPSGVGARRRVRIGDDDLVEETLSHEPPWRRVTELDGAPVRLCQCTLTLRDDGDTCHLAWTALAEPEPGFDGATEFLSALREEIRVAATRLAEISGGR